MKHTSHFVHKPDLTNAYHVYETEVPLNLAFRLNFYLGRIELNGLGNEKMGLNNQDCHSHSSFRAFQSQSRQQVEGG